jgi:hypothetical protein
MAGAAEMAGLGFRQPGGHPRHSFKTMNDRSESAARAMREDVTRVSRGRPCHWVTVHEVAHRLGLDDEASEAAVRRAIAEGWFVADGDPPHSVRLSVVAPAT